MEELIDAVTTIGLDDAAITALGVLLNHIPRISEEHSWLDDLNRLI